MPKNRPYLFYELTNSICSQCLRKTEAKVIFEEGRVYLWKHCPRHGREKVLISTDVDYYKRCREFLKPAEMPQVWNTPIRYGCPYDCGLCPDHEQHSCLTLVEVTDHCNLQCPICYAESSPNRTTWRSLAEIERMLDAVVRNEGEPDIVQISGGEPTLHPQFFDILDMAKARPIRHLMVNTNGIRIAQDREFVRRLAAYMPGFEIYLQFDSLEKEALMNLRGADLREIRRKAVEHLNEFNISTTLVVTLKKGVNDGEIGRVIQYGLEQPAVRGVTFQPIQAAGRTEAFDPSRDRLTLSEVRQKIIEQSGVFAAEDIIPVPCHPDCLAMGYALKLNGNVIPLTGLIDPQILLEGGRNTIVFEQDQSLQERIFHLFSTSHSPQSSALSLRSLLCCLPQVALPDSIGYENVFRVIIMQFLDAHNFDVRSVKKSCVHIVHPDGRIIPFDTYNLFYRDGREEVLKALRDERQMEDRHV
ncbi:putative radical SAM superfamily Fe-S cluster-containing enzyme [Brevibacillus aydinogluensis]|jgi:7,8-dihydro-6-hydroxymethylpterin dimethyltransferase|uniref:Radical SAM protein n=1 Tax=Brevibacillus aydinogluensis TaxID=927786 RepID=A0AA48M4U0_9BACL|nr:MULTISPECIES: radical SAM protein [Brevibacillus]MBR8660435.1 radical SAM protein [Brevibacillus sp. NL20B1]MDT3415713.1 putative radical SAM superfamily Fe-S cluster-containing enzyme [Brevibacillus aydinogluensis]CAJ1001277.1 Radical SAM protein [Brevibacillus aydinogluensis]